MDDALGGYSGASLPVSASGSSSLGDPQQLARGGGDGMAPIPGASSYEAPPSPLPSPMPQMASVSADSSDELGLGEIFANENRSREGLPSVETVNEATMEIVESVGQKAQEAGGESKPKNVATQEEKKTEEEPEVKLPENGRKPEMPSPKPSSPTAVATPASVSVSPPRAKPEKSENAFAATPSKNAPSSGSGNVASAGTGTGTGTGTTLAGGKSPSSSKAKGPPQSPPPLPLEAQLAGHRRMACKARSVPEGHTPQTAYLSIPPSAPHGMVLACSHPECASSGKRFRFCVVCDIPVAKRNFLRRHSHGLISGAAAGGPGAPALAPGLAVKKQPGPRLGGGPPGSDGASSPSTPHCDSPASPRSASSGARSDEEGTGPGGRTKGATRPRARHPAAHAEVLMSPGRAGGVDRDEGGPLDPLSPMSTGSVRPRTASDGSNRSALGSPGKRPREGGSPARGGLVGAVVHSAPPSSVPAQPPPVPGPGSTTHIARPLPYRPPPIQHCVSWPLANAGHHHHHAHGAPTASPMAATTASSARPLMHPGGPSGWAPSTPGGGAPVATQMIPHYASWSAGSPSHVARAQPPHPPPPPPAQPAGSSPPQIPHTSTLSTTTPMQVSPRYLRGPSKSFDAAIDRDRGRRYPPPDRAAERKLSPGLGPELQAKSSLRSSRSDDDVGLNRNDGAWARSSSGRIEYRGRSPSRLPDSAVWRGRMKSDSALPMHDDSAVWRGRMKSDSALPTHDELRGSRHRARQVSEPPQVRRCTASTEDDFEPPTPEISVMRLNRRERMWLNLLRRRPFEEEVDALKTWMDEVMSISDPRRRGDDDGSPAGVGAPRPLGEVVRHARVPARQLGEDLKQEGQGTAERSPGSSGVKAPSPDRPEPVQVQSVKQNSPRRQKVEGNDLIAETRGDRNATNKSPPDVGARSAHREDPKHVLKPPGRSHREDPKHVVKPPELGLTAEKVTAGFTGLFGCGALLCGDTGDCAVPCAPCGNSGAVDDSVRRGASKDLAKPFPVSNRQQSKESLASSVSMGNSSAAAFFENTAIMDIDRNSDVPFERMARGGSVSSASVSQIGEDDMDDPDRRAALEESIGGFDESGNFQGGSSREKGMPSGRRMKDPVIFKGKNLPSAHEEHRFGNVSVRVRKASSNMDNSAVGNMEMEAQWRPGEGVARG